VASTAERIDGGFRMNGRKSWIGNAALADVTEIWDGTSEIQRLAISRALPGR
jgi:alkylation response protein AidB-like acyl-CoA dehydrogenase